MKKYYYYGHILILFIALVLSGCGSGGDSGTTPSPTPAVSSGVTPTPTATPTPTPTSYTPGQSSTCTVGGVSFNIHYVPSAASFPTGTDDSGTGSVSNTYWIAETEVTYQLWNVVYTWATNASRGVNQYHFQNTGMNSGNTNQYPVIFISWRDAMVWSNALTEYYNAQNGTSLACVYTYSDTIVRDSRDSNFSTCDNVIASSTAKGFRLPASDEWELAARYQDGTNWTPGNHVSGDITGYCYPSDAGTSTVFGNYAWYWGNSGGITHSVASKPQKNALGLYDMSGDVWELCFEWCPYNLSLRVWRGGSWSYGADVLQVGYVGGVHPNFAGGFLGFRPVRTQ